jgi:hypothetical protein
MNCDDDIATMSADELRREVKKLRDAIRQQRDQKGHDLCWYIPELWDVLPERIHPKPEVPEWSEFIQHCAAFRKSLDDDIQK